MVLELFGDISWGGSGDLDPGFREESTGAQDEKNVDDGLDWIQERFLQVQRRLHVVGKTGDSKQLLAPALLGLPGTDELDDQVVWEP